MFLYFEGIVITHKFDKKLYLPCRLVCQVHDLGRCWIVTPHPWDHTGMLLSLDCDTSHFVSKGFIQTLLGVDVVKERFKKRLAAWIRQFLLRG